MHFTQCPWDTRVFPPVSLLRHRSSIILCPLPLLHPPPSSSALRLRVPSGASLRNLPPDMALFRRQEVTYEVFDDQSPELWGRYVGNWTYQTGQTFYNHTFTSTPTPGAFLSFTFSGSEACVYGGVLNTNKTSNFPIANYTVDGILAGPQTPYFYSSQLIYFATPKLSDGTHTINITVRRANRRNPYILDYITITPSTGESSSGVMTTTTAPSSTTTPITTTQPTSVGVIVGGVVGGIAGIAILAIAACYLLNRRSRRNQPYYFERPSTDNVLAGEALLNHVEPFTTTPPPSIGLSGPGPHPANSDDNSNQSSDQPSGQTATSSYPPQSIQSGTNETDLTYVPDDMTRPRTGKAALIAQRNRATRQPIQYLDSGMRFDAGAGPSQIPTEVPPTYTDS